MSNILNEARRLRTIIEQASASLDDKTASTAHTLFPNLKGDGSLVKAGTRINWKGMIKKATMDMWDTEAITPDNAPNLWEDIQYREGYRIIPDVITVTSVFAMDECGWWRDKLYKSLIPANVYTPEQYPAGWEVIV